MRCDYARAGREPALEELLRDPVVQLVMRRDGLERRDVERAIAVVRRRLFPTIARPRDIPQVAPSGEGGWAPAELEAGLATVALGGGILRAETAAIVAGALLVAFRARIVTI